LYVPAFAGTAIVVAWPAARVMVGPSAKLAVPAGANHTVFEAFPLLRIPRLLVPAVTEALAGNT
jgi:hypothetical protein